MSSKQNGTVTALRKNCSVQKELEFYACRAIDKINAPPYIIRTQGICRPSTIILILDYSYTTLYLYQIMRHININDFLFISVRRKLIDWFSPEFWIDATRWEQQPLGQSDSVDGEVILLFLHFFFVQIHEHFTGNVHNHWKIKKMVTSWNVQEKTKFEHRKKSSPPFSPSQFTSCGCSVCQPVLPVKQHNICIDELLAK